MPILAFSRAPAQPMTLRRRRATEQIPGAPYLRKPPENSRDLAVITTANGKAESTEEATGHLDDLDASCHDDAVGRFTSSTVFGFIMRRIGLLLRMEKGRVSIIDQI